MLAYLKYPWGCHSWCINPILGGLRNDSICLKMGCNLVWQRGSRILTIQKGLHCWPGTDWGQLRTHQDKGVRGTYWENYHVAIIHSPALCTLYCDKLLYIKSGRLPFLQQGWCNHLQTVQLQYSYLYSAGSTPASRSFYFFSPFNPVQPFMMGQKIISVISHS